MIDIETQLYFKQKQQHREKNTHRCKRRETNKGYGTSTLNTAFRDKDNILEQTFKKQMFLKIYLDKHLFKKGVLKHIYTYATFV